MNKHASKVYSLLRYAGIAALLTYLFSLCYGQTTAAFLFGFVVGYPISSWVDKLLQGKQAR